MEECEVRPRRALGWLLVGAGVLGMVCGIVPFVITGLRIATGRSVPAEMDWLAHGIESLALSAEWAMLSSAMGTFLGIMLLWAGAGWIRGRPWAAAVTWMYVLAGLTVNVTDMIIFALKAKDGPMRTDMLLLDGVATLIAAGLAAWLLLRRRPASGPPG